MTLVFILITYEQSCVLDTNADEFVKRYFARNEPFIETEEKRNAIFYNQTSTAIYLICEF